MISDENLEYWRATWFETALRLRHIGGAPDFSAPQFVLQDLADELRLSRLERPAVREDYVSLLKQAQSRNVVKRHFRAHFECVRLALIKWKGWTYAQEQVDLALRQLERSYGKVAVEELVEVLEQTTSSLEQQRHLQQLSNDLIIALLLRGYSLKFVADLEQRLFEEQPTRGAGATFAPDLDPADPDYHRQIELRLRALTSSERIRALDTFFEPRTRAIRYIFQLRGLRYFETLEIGDVTIYDPVLNPKVLSKVPGKRKSQESFGQDGTEDYRFPNIAVLVRSDERDTDGAAASALRLANRCLDMIKPSLASSSTLRVADNSYIWTTEAWEERGGSFSRGDDEHLVQMTRAPDLSTSDVSNIANELCGAPLAVKGTSEEAKRRLLRALHVRRRGEESKRPDDKLTNHWVALETLLELDALRARAASEGSDGIMQLILRVVPPLFIRRRHVFSVGWDLHRHLRTYVSDPFNPPKIDFSPEVRRKCGLEQAKGTLHLRNILDGLPDLVTEVPANSYPRLIQRVDETLRFYSDPKTALEQISATLEATRRTLVRLYRARNRVVHDAASHGPLFESLSDFAEDISGVLINEALRLADKAGDLTDALLETEARVELLQELLRTGKQVDLLSWFDTVQTG